MTTRQHSSFAIVFILGLLAMLMPLSIDMYLPALPVISAQFGVPAGSTPVSYSHLTLPPGDPELISVGAAPLY
ncbi:MAG TPA: hypothetical protein DDZ03_12600, partial [Shigella sp.]|nr:hypothetical protein [Shigella sp.]